MPRLPTALLGLAALWVCGCQPHHEKPEEPGVFAATTPLRRDTELTHEYVAQVRAIQHIEVRAQERGYLTEIFVDEGQRVSKGTKMFQIMPLIYQADVERTQAEVDVAQIEYQNTAMLADKNVVSPAELALAKARLDKSKADRSLARTHRKLTEIRAPFTGLMDRFEVRLGSLVEEGELLTKLSDISTLWIYFNVPEAAYLDYQTNGSQPRNVKFKMANDELYPHDGKVETIEADFDNATGNIAFRATFPNPDGLLRHGETGNIVVATTYPNAMLIPQKATFEILDRRYVFVVDDAGVVSQRAIKVAAELPHVFVVSEGLADNDKFLLEGLRKVRDGSHVETRLEDPNETLAHLDVPAE
jgi:membrane fusion protein (multidrug efflux system)